MCCAHNTCACARTDAPAYSNTSTDTPSTPTSAMPACAADKTELQQHVVRHGVYVWRRRVSSTHTCVCVHTPHKHAHCFYRGMCLAKARCKNACRQTRYFKILLLPRQIITAAANKPDDARQHHRLFEPPSNQQHQPTNCPSKCQALEIALQCFACLPACSLVNPSTNTNMHTPTHTSQQLQITITRALAVPVFLSIYVCLTLLLCSVVYSMCAPQAQTTPAAVPVHPALVPKCILRRCQEAAAANPFQPGV